MGAAPRKDSGVNKFRDDCRKLVRECQHPELTVTAKFVLLTLIDYTTAATIPPGPPSTPWWRIRESAAAQ